MRLGSALLQKTVLSPWPSPSVFVVVLVVELVIMLVVVLVVGGPEEKVPFFHIAPGPILSSPTNSNSSQYDPCKVWLKNNDHFLTCGAAKVHIFLCTSD